MIPVLTSKKASELPVSEVASILQVSFWWGEQEEIIKLVFLPYKSLWLCPKEYSVIKEWLTNVNSVVTTILDLWNVGGIG